MGLRFLQFSETSFSILSCFGHVLIESLNFFALLLGLHGNVLSDVVNVLHDGLNLGDVLLSLLNHLIHVVYLSVDLDP